MALVVQTENPSDGLEVYSSPTITTNARDTFSGICCRLLSPRYSARTCVRACHVCEAYRRHRARVVSVVMVDNMSSELARVAALTQTLACAQTLKERIYDVRADGFVKWICIRVLIG